MANSSLTDPLALEDLDVRVGHLWVLRPESWLHAIMERMEEAAPPFAERPGVLRLQTKVSADRNPCST
jgi:hypothetical protein